MYSCKKEYHIYQKIRCYSNHASPQNVKELKQFLELTGYYRKHINHCADITHTLTCLLRKDKTIHMDRSVSKGFHRAQKIPTKTIHTSVPRSKETFLPFHRCFQILLGSNTVPIPSKSNIKAIVIISGRFLTHSVIVQHL